MKLFNAKLIKFAIKINFFWGIFYFLTNKIINKNRFNKNLSNNKILIFDFHLIGDIVLLIPFLRAIKNGPEKFHITLVCGPWAKEVLQNEGLVDDFIFFVAPWVKYIGFVNSIKSLTKLITSLKSMRWDVAIDIRGDIRQIFLLYLSGSNRRIGFNFMGGDALLTDVVWDDGQYRHLLEHHRQILNKLKIHVDPQDFIPRISLDEGEQLLSSSMHKYVGVHFGASLPLRRLPIKEQIKLLDKLSLEKKHIVIFVPPDDLESTESLLNLIPLTKKKYISLWSGSLREMIVKISAAERVYVMDSGAAHISAALGIPTTVLFGPNLPALVMPIGPNVEIREKLGLTCRPCNQIRCINSINQCCLIDIT
jgi:ADP-heptose:LPS heptosyltransferase